MPNLPDVPTVGETVPGFEFYSWYGLWGPAKLPEDIAARLNAEVNKALAGDMREKLTQQGLLLDARLDRRLRQVPARRHGARRARSSPTGTSVPSEHGDAPSSPAAAPASARRSRERLLAEAGA